jgi:hypothetical protein
MPTSHGTNVVRRSYAGVLTQSVEGEEIGDEKERDSEVHSDHPSVTPSIRSTGPTQSTWRVSVLRVVKIDPTSTNSPEQEKVEVDIQRQLSISARARSHSRLPTTCLLANVAAVSVCTARLIPFGPLWPAGYIRKRLVQVRIRDWKGHGDPYPDLSIVSSLFVGH